MGTEIPLELRKFYTDVGHGHLVVSRNGHLQSDYFNIIVEPARLAALYCRTEVSFQYDAELTASGEMPFFDMGSYSYFVLRPHTSTPDAVYAPYDRTPIASSFNEFISRLREDTVFYIDRSEQD